MAKRENWKTRLTPFADIEYARWRAMHDLLNSMSADELRQLLDDCKRPTETNCGWALYEIAKVLPRAIQTKEAMRS